MTVNIYSVWWLMFSQVISSWFSIENLPLVVTALVFLLTGLFTLGLLSLRKSSISRQQAEEQQQLLLQLVDRVNSIFEVNASNQQQLQQQLLANHQYLTNQQADLKNHFEQQISTLKLTLLRQQNEQAEKQAKLLADNNTLVNQTLHNHHHGFNENQIKSTEQLVAHLAEITKLGREEMAKSLTLSSDQMTKRINELTLSTDNRLKEISGQVEKRLADGFEKTTKTFNDILQRLALIDDAQKKITELSTNVVSLQEVLSDKRSRGAFGEVQLSALIRNVLPEHHFSLQHTLSNGKIADCILFLPAPTGNVVIDSKFPLESYKKMADNLLGEFERKAAQRQFKIDIKKHINDISGKYLIDKETADGAIMFIPAEAIFAEIHAHHSDLVEFANKKRVWLASPTTLMAILTTARSVLKDEATRKQVHVIQAHLSQLSSDFARFKGRFANLAKHIDQAATDVKQIHTSADKISSRFEKIEQVDVQIEDANQVQHTSEK